jgi:Tfp pilus assembly protein PilV
MYKNIKWFSILEILVGVFLFMLTVVSIFAIFNSTLRLNSLNRDYIKATWLASEQIELVRNIRDSNFKKIKKYNLTNPNSLDNNNVFEIWHKYIIENDYSQFATFPIKVNDITDTFEDNQLNYKFYKYISIEEIKYNDNNENKIINNSFLLKSKVIWNNNWYHEFELKTIITDFNRL